MSQAVQQQDAPAGDAPRAPAVGAGARPRPRPRWLPHLAALRRRTHRISYRVKVIVGVCVLVLVTGLAITVVSLRSHSATARAMAGKLFEEVSAHAVTQTQSHLMRAVPLIESLEHMAGDGLDLENSDHLARQLADILGANQGITWISYGNERGAFTGAYRTAEGALRVNQSRIENGRTLLVEHDVLPDGSWRLHRRNDDGRYDPRTRPYYTRARDARRLVWLPPYVFYDQAVPGISCANPVIAPSGELVGVLTVDFDLNTLSAVLPTLSVSPHSKFFLFTTDGTLLAYPGQRLVVEHGHGTEGRLLTLGDVQDPLVQEYRRHVLTDAIRRSDGTGAQAFRKFEFDHAGERYFASSTPFKVDDGVVWVVGAVAPAGDFLSDVWRARETETLIAGVALLVAVVLAVALANRVSGPVLSMIALMRRVGGGDLEARADFGRSREFDDMSVALNRMIDDLRDRLRMRHSLSVANEVQQGLLPAAPPAVPGLDVAGYSAYCDETGGDYYDFLLPHASPDGSPPRALTAVVGDVTGHGVAAALVMAGVRAVLRDRATDPSAPLAPLMARLNELLIADLGGKKFMTMLVCVVDLAARQLRWSSAGHDPAFVYDPAADDFLALPRGDLPLGVEPGTEYHDHAVPLPPGAVIVMATDGVWESRNAASENFGKRRLRDVIRANARRGARDIADAVNDQVTRFRGPCDSQDDVTYVVMKCVP
jgi:serine phosphatase RsbU (regulator of sigma subunit)